MNGNGDLKEKYCVTIPGVKKDHKYIYDTMSVLLEIDQTLAPIKVFDSIDEAVNAAKADKENHPIWNYEVRKYFGNNTDMLKIDKEGRWKIGKEVLRMV